MPYLYIFSSEKNAYIGKIRSDILNDLAAFPRSIRTEMIFAELNMESMPRALAIGRGRIIISRDKISHLGKYGSYIEIEALFVTDIYTYFLDNYSTEISLSYLKEIDNGKRIREIDVVNMIHFENGIDYKEEERSALGM
ncbi:hypothetical protein GS535_03495 [Saccharibacter sp. EH611]|uniref:phage major tail tube protein n=1 Tax=unclassified Saccharibacter TaxID=2648722 RepID=UPI00132891C1|nr:MULTISPECIES: phage major tail tube protein [unclassified Saccharibacter]MXV35621.1 hypothetical protein [Saccharibacter sp. EH611]MXV65767.1 hypothetical protein [Saccharibacter sp. EH60]